MAENNRIKYARARKSTLRKITLENQDRMMVEFLAGATSKSLSSRYGVGPGYIRHLAYIRGLPAPRSRKYSLRSDAFDDGSPEASYWIGMVMADGYVGYGRLGMSLAERDVEHLKKLQKFLESNHPITRRDNSKNRFKASPSATLTIGSPEIVASLEKFGVIPRKSSVAKVIGLENDADFWRGVIDGDGSVGFVNHRNRKGIIDRAYPYIALVGSRDLVGQFYQFCLKITDKTPPPREQKPGMFALLVRGYASIPIIRGLYTDATVYLDRKFAKVEDIFRHYENAVK